MSTRQAFVDELPDDVPQLAPRQRIDADGRLVEEQELRHADERAGEAELLLHAAREPPRQPAGERPERRHLHEARIALRPLGDGDAVQVGVEVEVLLHAQVLVEAEPLRHVADPVLHRCGLLPTSMPSTSSLPESGAMRPADEPDQRGLAGAVRSDERGELAVADIERHVVERHDGLAGLAAERLADVLAADREASVAHGMPRLSSAAENATGVAILAGLRIDGRRHAEAKDVVGIVDVHPHLVDEAGAQLVGLHRLRRELGDRRDEADAGR